jgi:hypothetical protein
VAHVEQWLIVTGIGLLFVARESVRLDSLTVESAASGSTASTV